VHYDVVPENEFEIWSTGFANKQEITVALTNRLLAFNLVVGRCLFRNLVETTTIITDVFRGFLLFSHIWHFTFGRDPLLTYRCQFTLHGYSDNWARYSLELLTASLNNENFK
jgi:hypothetical protein